MTKYSLIQKLQALEPYGMQEFWDKKFEGSCPCFWGKKKIGEYYIELHGHCWRTCPDMNAGKSHYCSFNGLHVTSDMPKKELRPIIGIIKHKLDEQEWYDKWEVHYDK